MVAIEDVCELIVDCVNKTAPVVDRVTSYRMIRTTNVRNGRIDLTECRHVEESTYKTWTRRAQLQVGDVVLTREAPIGEVGFVTEAEGVFLGQKLMQYRANPQVLDSRYLLYSFLSPALQHQFGSHEGSGSVVSHIRVGDCFKFKLQLPPLHVQREIAKTLGAIDDRITLLRETNTTLEAIAQALFKSWFVDFDPVHAKMQGRAPEGMDEAIAALFPDSFEESELGPVPKGWRVERLGDVVERVTKGTTPTTLKRPFVEKGINFVKAESMTDDGGFLPEKFAFIDQETHEILKRSQLQDGDVLISIAGTIGRSAVITEDFLPANTNQAVALIRPKQDVFPSGLLWRFLKQENAMQLMGERVVQAVQANLSLGTLSDMRLVLPPSTLTMRLFEIAFSAIDKSKALNGQKVRALSTLRDTLLPRLISGQLRLSEAEAIVESA